MKKPFIALLALLVVTLSLFYLASDKSTKLASTTSTESSPKTVEAAARVSYSLNDRFGVVGALPSLTTNTSRINAGATKIAEGHFGWSRHEFHYSSKMSFTFYDRARNAQASRGVKTLGLLAYPGSGRSMNDWRNYVRSVVGHYGGNIQAWEIMNEADTYLSPGDYANYLREARAIIKGINPGATIVTSGITSRPEAANFIDGLAAAGVWDQFDVIGLHLYHGGSPETVNFGGGSVSNEISRIVGSIKRNGGGKSIWITEMGYKASEYGADRQGDLLARAAIMARTFDEVDKIFFYRLYDNDANQYGLLTSSMQSKSSYNTVSNLVANLNGRGTATRIFHNYQTVENFDSLRGWNADDTTNGGLGLSDTAGVAGNALKMDYQFSADSAYASAEKQVGSWGEPAGFSAWVWGDNSKNVWKFRVVDSEGETFQMDYGSLTSGWQNIQFRINKDPGMVSWGGNGAVDFPIAFSTVIIDRQGGQDAGSGAIDEIAYLPDRDLFEFRIGDLATFWSDGNDQNAGFCEEYRTFRSSPQYVTGKSC